MSDVEATAAAPRRLRRRTRRIVTLLLRTAAVLLAVTFCTFMIVQLLPGDPARVLLGESASADQVATLRHELGLDRPILTQYGDWLSGAATGDLGRSHRSRQEVSEAIAQRLPVSLELMLLAQLGALGIAIPAAVRSAYRRGGWFDRVGSSMSYGFLALPSFMLGVILIYLFAVRWKVLPSSGFTRLTESPWENLRTLILPAATLALTEAPVYFRLLRTEMTGSLQQGFVDLAFSKGISERRVLWRHAFRPSTVSLVTLAGINIARLVGGAVIVETLFGLPGIGQMIPAAVYNRDLIMLQGAVLVVGVAFVITSTAIEILYPIIDPRLRVRT